MDSNSWSFSGPSAQSTTASSNSNQQGNSIGETNEVIIITVAVFVIFAAVCLLSRWLARRSHELNHPDEPQAQDLEKAKRMEFIKSHLPSRTIQVGSEDGNDEDELLDEVLDDEEKGKVPIQVTVHSITSASLGISNASVDDEGDESQQHCSSVCQCSRICSICLSCYHRKDNVAWSTNPNCPHLFHRKCIQSWLALHEECPLCRCIFLLQKQAPTLKGIALEPAGARGNED